MNNYRVTSVMTVTNEMTIMANTPQEAQELSMSDLETRAAERVEMHIDVELIGAKD